MISYTMFAFSLPSSVYCPSCRRQPTVENPLCSTCRQRHADMKRRVAQAHGFGPRRAGPLVATSESDQALLERMRPALRNIDAENLDTLLWKQCSSGADLHKLGKAVLAQGHQASLALRKVSCATAPAPGSECPRAAEASLCAWRGYPGRVAWRGYPG